MLRVAVSVPSPCSARVVLVFANALLQELGLQLVAARERMEETVEEGGGAAHGAAASVRAASVGDARAPNGAGEEAEERASGVGSAAVAAMAAGTPSGDDDAVAPGAGAGAPGYQSGNNVERTEERAGTRSGDSRRGDGRRRQRELQNAQRQTKRVRFSDAYKIQVRPDELRLAYALLAAAPRAAPELRARAAAYIERQPVPENAGETLLVRGLEARQRRLEITAARFQSSFANLHTGDGYRRNANVRPTRHGGGQFALSGGAAGSRLALTDTPLHEEHDEGAHDASSGDESEVVM